MEPLGVGIDVIELSRFREARFFDRVAEYVLRDMELKEMDESRDRVQYLASRFAAKEAVIKAFPSPLTYQDFRIDKKASKPVVAFVDPRYGKYHVLLSISHSFQHVVSCANVFERTDV